jgi:hypothetical protein
VSFFFDGDGRAPAAAPFALAGVPAAGRVARCGVPGRLPFFGRDGSGRPPPPKDDAELLLLCRLGGSGVRAAFNKSGDTSNDDWACLVRTTPAKVGGSSKRWLISRDGGLGGRRYSKPAFAMAFSKSMYVKYPSTN